MLGDCWSFDGWGQSMSRENSPDIYMSLKDDHRIAHH